MNQTADQKSERTIVLAIETAIGGGGLAIVTKGKTLDYWNGEQRVSKAEDLLEQIGEILNRNRVDKKQIKTIGVSKNIGSLTGEKIGRAIAKGLAKALGVPAVELSLLDALAEKVQTADNGELIIGIVNVSAGVEYIIWQRKEKRDEIFLNLSEPVRTARDEFYKLFPSVRGERIIIFRSGIENEPTRPQSAVEFRCLDNSTENYATILGLSV